MSRSSVAALIAAAAFSSVQAVETVSGNLPHETSITRVRLVSGYWTLTREVVAETKVDEVRIDAPSRVTSPANARGVPTPGGPHAENRKVAR